MSKIIIPGEPDESQKSDKFRVVAYVGAFVPTEHLVFQSRFEWLARKVAAWVSKRRYLGVPLKFINKDGSFEWLNTWADKTLDEQKRELDVVGETEGRNDVIAVKEDLMRFGEVVDLSEKTEEQVLKEIEAVTKPKLNEGLDDSTQRLEQIRQDMEKKKRAARNDDKKIILIK